MPYTIHGAQINLHKNQMNLHKTQYLLQISKTLYRKSLIYITLVLHIHRCVSILFLFQDLKYIPSPITLYINDLK